jgi:hypothetical protein
LENFTATGARVEVGAIQVTVDLKLEADRLLVLQGARYQAGGTISLNPATRSAASGKASIVKPSGDLQMDAEHLVMGAEQKWVVNQGSLSITAESAVIGDLAASKSLSLDVGRLEVLAREAGEFTNAGLRDVGVSIVSPQITFKGVLAYSPGAAGKKRVYWNTVSGSVSGTNNVTKVEGSMVGKNTRMASQFSSLDIDGDLLQPLAMKPVPVSSAVSPIANVVPSFVFPGFPSEVRQFDLMNWSLGYREEIVERLNGIWVLRSLGLNGRWNALSGVLAGEGRDPQEFIEL